MAKEVVCSQALDAAPPSQWQAPSLRALFGVFGKIGLMSFGGPAAQIALMHTILVEERGWISERRFLHALNFCMLLPGPEAQQLATYCGFRLRGTQGGLIAGLLFIMPGVGVLLALSLAYVTLGAFAGFGALLLGLKAAVLAILLRAIAALARRTLTTKLSWIVALFAFIALFLFALPFPLIILGAALTGFVLKAAEPVTHTAEDAARYDATMPVGLTKTLARAGLWLAIWLIVPVGLMGLAQAPILSALAWFFSKTALVAFGGAYAVLAYVAAVTVGDFGWLTPGEMLDGLGLAETTPGPLIMVLQFVGFLAAYKHPGTLDPMVCGILGALVTSYVTFAPCFLWIFAGAPFCDALFENRACAGALTLVRAASVGVMANLAVWLGLHVLFSAMHPVALFAGQSLSVPIWATFQPLPLALGVLAFVALTHMRLSVAKSLFLTCLTSLVILFATRGHF